VLLLNHRAVVCFVMLNSSQLDVLDTSVLTHGVFTCCEPSESRWGSADNKRPKGQLLREREKQITDPEPGTAHWSVPVHSNELCTEGGDAEEFVKAPSDKP
jgi:hypothetical protein